MSSNFIHHVITITVQDEQVCNFLRGEIIAIAKKRMQVKNPDTLLSNVQESLINNFFTFSFCPDGSKEGYETSVEADDARKDIIQLLTNFKNQSSSVIYFIEVAYGDLESSFQIINKSA